MPFDLDATPVRWDDGWFQCMVLYYSMQMFNGSIYDMRFDGFRPIGIPIFGEGCKTSESLSSFFQPFRRIFIVREICRGIRHVGHSSTLSSTGQVCNADAPSSQVFYNSPVFGE